MRWHKQTQEHEIPHRSPKGGKEAKNTKSGTDGLEDRACVVSSYQLSAHKQNRFRLTGLEWGRTGHRKNKRLPLNFCFFLAPPPPPLHWLPPWCVAFRRQGFLGIAA